MEEMVSETGDASITSIAARLPYGVQTDEEDAQKLDLYPARSA